MCGCMCSIGTNCSGCPDPEQDRRFIEQLHADYTRKQRVDVLSTRQASRLLLDEGFARFRITGLDPRGRIRQWLIGSGQKTSQKQRLKNQPLEFEDVLLFSRNSDLKN